MIERKTYLGDSVYAEFDGHEVTLTTENDINGPSNTIVLEPEVYAALVAWVEHLKEDAKHL